ncbi:galactose oxidase-like domain-containing protein [Gelidibacter mesophilus]|uniref:galactose oxidase-like domain-containing protein n=1 Tax=Gelidibacter mesophilus TaxID=169050 RepID=UPI000408A75B|nr:galactose oxidase-like domain-containing protein [Gelidibacter mesophilus]
MTRLYFSAVSLVLSLIGLKTFSQSPQVVGQWSDPISFDIVPVAVANLPDGRLVTWSSKYHDDFGGDDGYTFTQVFDPLGGPDGLGGILPRTVTDTNHDMFCPGINNLPDGRIMVTGGSSAEKTSIYDPRTNVWTAGDDLNIPRGYQGSVTLSDGSIFTIGGSWSGSATFGGRDAEIWTETSGWRRLTGLPGELLWNSNDLAGEKEEQYRLDNHAWLFAAPNGKIFHAGPGENMHWIDVTGNSGNGSFWPAGPSGKRGVDHMSMNGNSTLYDIGKILKIGGSASYSSNTISNKKAFVIDINNENDVTVTPTGPMAQGRIYVTSVVLPNGEVLVMGGMENAVVFSDNNAHLTAEIYSPLTNSFQTLASMQVPRTYHSTGVLLPDGRVFMGGGGLCGEKCGANHKDAEIFSPPYLFNSSGGLATRPTLNAPDKAYYNSSLPVTTSVGSNPDFSFLRFSSATHSVNNEQRRVPVTYTGSNGNYQLNIPNANIMPPGYYMLFVLDDNGIPSIAETVWVGSKDDQVANANLLVEFDFFEGAGNRVNDLSGNNNHGTIKERNDAGEEIGLKQEYWSTDGIYGNALEMDGIEHLSNSIIEIPTSGSLESITNQITVMAWVNRNTESVVAQDGNKIPNVSIFSHDYPRSFFMGYHASEFKVEFRTLDGNHFNGYTGTHYTPGKWEHFVMTYNGAIGRVYVDGKQIFEHAVSGNLKINAGDNLTGNTFTLSGFYDTRTSGLPGYANYSGISDELDGRMDDFKLYDTALTEAEIQSIYNAERKIVKNDNPCDDVTLVYEVNGKRDNGAKELTLKVGDSIGFFLNKDDIDFEEIKVIGPDGETFLNSNIINGITTAQAGVYQATFTLKDTSYALDLKAIYASSEMNKELSNGSKMVHHKRFKENAVDKKPLSYWSTEWGNTGDVVPKHDHEIHFDVGETSNISGIEYLPRHPETGLNGTIKTYEIYVSNSTSSWGAPVATSDTHGEWAYTHDLKTVIFPEKEGRYLRLVAKSAYNNSPQATIGELNVILIENTECYKELKINVHTPKTFTYDESWSAAEGDPSGVSTKYDDIVIESGQGAVFSANTTVNNLTINSGASLTVDEQKILTFQSITLNSDATAFASLIDKGWVAGDVIYNRYVNVMGTEAGGGNDLVSSPVTSAVFNSEFVTNNPKLSEHPDANGTYAFAPYIVVEGKYKNFDIGTDRSGKIPIVSGVGYRMATTDVEEENFKGSPVTFIGNINRNVVNVPLADPVGGNGWNLIGNPYPAYIDFYSFLNENIDQLDERDAYQAVYAYTGKANRDKWRIINFIPQDDSANIAPGQGFFVKSKSGGGLVNFLPEMRTTQGSGSYIENRSNINKVLSKLSLRRAEAVASTSVYFIDGTTRGLDPGYDAAEFGGSKIDFAIFTNLLEDNKGLGIAIQALPYEDFNDVVVPLGIRAKGGQELTISVDDLSTLPSNVNVYLEDTQNKTLTYLNNEDFKFTPTQDINVSDRFNVHYSSKTLSVDDLVSNNIWIYTTAVPKTLFIKGQLGRSTNACLYDIQGRLVMSKILDSNNPQNTLDISTIGSGVYVVKVSNDNLIKTQKVIIK